jgi:phage tail-like protein
VAEFTVNAKRIDPYKNFKFKIKWDGQYVAGVSKCSALKKTTEVIKHRSGGDPGTTRKSLGQTDWEPITLERGVTYDAAFEQWANKVWDYANSSQLGQEASLADFRKDIIIELYNVAGQKVLAYNVYRCWPSEFVAMPELDGSGNAVAIQSLTLQCEGWERDTSVTEQAEPSYTLPS